MQSPFEKGKPARERAVCKCGEEIEITPDMIEAAAEAIGRVLYDPQFSRHDWIDLAERALRGGLSVCHGKGASQQ